MDSCSSSMGKLVMSAGFGSFTGDVPVAAVQMDGRLADLPYNIGQAGHLATRALTRGARIVALPEFFTTPIVYDERLFSCSLPQDNPALDMMKTLAVRHEAMIGGSYLELRDGDVFNTYVLVEPDGSVHRHDKDLPTMVENAFYIGGNDPGRAETNAGRVGMAVCWETIRTATVDRLAHRTDLLMTGSHWWSEPGWSFPRTLWNWADRYNEVLMARTPALFARMVGAPSLHAAHCGRVDGRFLLTSGWSVRTSARLMGETQIIDSSGQVVSRRKAQDGAGLAEAKIRLGAVAPTASVPRRFWIDALPSAFRMYWAHQNATCRTAYVRAKAQGILRTYEFAEGPPFCFE